MVFPSFTSSTFYPLRSFASSLIALQQENIPCCTALIYDFIIQIIFLVIWHFSYILATKLLCHFQAFVRYYLLHTTDKCPRQKILNNDSLLQIGVWICWNPCKMGAVLIFASCYFVLKYFELPKLCFRETEIWSFSVIWSYHSESFFQCH